MEASGRRIDGNQWFHWCFPDPIWTPILWFQKNWNHGFQSHRVSITNCITNTSVFQYICFLDVIQQKYLNIKMDELFENCYCSFSETSSSHIEMTLKNLIGSEENWEHLDDMKRIFSLRKTPMSGSSSFWTQRFLFCSSFLRILAIKSNDYVTVKHWTVNSWWNA